MFYNTRGVYTCKPLRFDMAKCLDWYVKACKKRFILYGNARNTMKHTHCQSVFVLNDCKIFTMSMFLYFCFSESKIMGLPKDNPAAILKTCCR